MIGSFAAHLGRAAPGLVAAALCLVNVAFAWRWLPESRVRETGPARPRRPVWHPAWTAIRHPGAPLSRLLWIYGIGMVAFASQTSVLALYLGAEFGLDARTIGPIFTYIGIAVVRDAERRCWVRSWTGWVSCGPCGSARSRWRSASGSIPTARVAVGVRGRHPPCADRDGAAVSIHYLTHVPPVRPARAGHHDGRGPDVRRTGAGGGAAARDDGVPAARPRSAVLSRAAPAWRSPGCWRSRSRSVPASPRIPRRRKKRGSHEHGRAARAAGAAGGGAGGAGEGETAGRRGDGRAAQGRGGPAVTRWPPPVDRVALRHRPPHPRRPTSPPPSRLPDFTSGGSASAASSPSASSPS